MARQISRYESSVSRLHAAAAGLQDNIAMYNHTLVAVRPEGGARSSSGSEKYVCTSDKLQRKGLISASSLPTLEDVDPKLVAKYWPKASFSFELRPEGEIRVGASVKGRTMWESTLRLDELLRLRAAGTEHIEHEGVELYLPALLELIDAKLYRKSDKKR